MNWEAVFNFLKTYGSLIAALTAIIISLWTFRRTRSSTLYSDIDGRYLELIKLSITNPQFVNPELTENYQDNFKGNDLLMYKQYAFAAWNIVETIYDRRKDKELFETWKSVIKEENRLHREWLNNEENQHKFKNDFLNFIMSSKYLPCPQCKKEGVSPCSRCVELKRLAAGDEMPVVTVKQLSAKTLPDKTPKSTA